jgi:hypothetical protein
MRRRVPASFTQNAGFEMWEEPNIEDVRCYTLNGSFRSLGDEVAEPTDPTFSSGRPRA